MRKFALFLLLTVNSYAASGPFQAERYFKNNGGKFDHISPLLTPLENASDINNFTLDDRGQLTARAGFTILNSTGVLISTTAVVTGGGFHKAASGTDFFAIIVGTNVYRTSNTFGGTYTNVTGTTTITAGATNLAQHTSLNDTEIFCNESDTPFGVQSTGNSFTLTAVSTGAKTCTTYGSYLLIANTNENSTSFPSRIRWSDINNPSSWPALNFVDIEPNDGDKIVDIITFKDSVYVFKQRSIYRMMITGLDGADAFIVRPFSRNLGCYAKNSVRVIPNLGIAFLATNTLYILGDNELSSYNYSVFDPVGDKIQRTFDNIINTQRANAVGAVYPRRYQYWLSISTIGTTNSQTLVYDYIQKAWTTYTGLNINMMDQALTSNGDNILILGDYNGNNYKLDESATSDKIANVQTAITTSYTTGWLTQNTPEYTKNYKYLYVYTQQSSTSTLMAQAAFDYNTSYEYSQNISLGTTGALYDTAVYDTDTYLGSGIVVNRFEIDRSAKAIKLLFTSSSNTTSINIIGWVLVYTNEDWKS